MQNLQKYTNLTSSIQQLDQEHENNPQQILDNINQNKRINELMLQIQRSDIQIQQLQSQNQALIKEKQAQQLQLNQYESLKTELQDHLGKIKNFEQQLKQQYQERNERDIQQLEEQYKRKYHVLIERLEHHFNARYNDNSDIIEFIDENFRSIENNFVGLQRQIQNLQYAINNPVNQVQQPESLLAQKTDDQQTKQYHTFLNTQINILAQQISNLQMEKQILKQICHNQEISLQDVNAFLNNKVHEKTSKKIKIVKIVIRFCIILKHNCNKQVQKSFNQKYFIVNVENMKLREYIRPENQYQFINILNKNMNNMLQMGKTRVFVNFRSPQMFSAIKAKFDDVIIQNEALQSAVNSGKIEKDNLTKTIDELNEEIIDMRLKLKMLDKNVSFDRYQQLLTENQLLNDKIVEITAMFNKQEREVKLLQREKEKTDVLNNHQAEAINELVELRRAHGSLLSKFNDLKLQLEHQKEEQNGFMYDTGDKYGSKTFNLSQHNDQQDKKYVSNIDQLISRNTHDYAQSKQQEEDQSLRSLTEKYIKHSLYSFHDLDKIHHNINQLELGYKYLQQNPPMKDRIFSLFDNK